MTDAIKIIEAIGGQWPFLIVVFIILMFVLKWKTIWAFIASITQIKVKRGQNELEITKETSDKQIKETKEDSISQEKEKPIDSSDQKPETDDNLHHSYYTALSDRDFKKAKEIFEKLLEEEKDEKLRKEKKLSNYYWRHLHGDTSAFQELENYIININNDDEHKSYAYYYLSNFYIDSNNFQKSLELLQLALKLTAIDYQKTLCIIKISETHYKNGDNANSIKILIESLTKIQNRDSLFMLYRSIAKYYANTNDKLLESIAFQKALELKPNDTDTIFDAAYNYSQIEISFRDLSLLLYKKLLGFNPKHQSTLNNIGVTYKDLNLEIKSVENYKASFEKGNTLAASNLAYLLIYNGFKDEAEEYLLKAQELKDIHDNVYNAASELKTKIRKESESEKKILEQANKKYLFFNSFGNAAFALETIKIENSTNWKLNQKNIQILIENNILNLSWEIDDEKHSIKGNILNNALFLTYKKPKRELYSFLDDSKYSYVDHKGYGYFSSSKNIICYFDIDKEMHDFTFITS